MLTTRKAARFRERSELPDFLLQVSTVTSQTLDLDELLAKVCEIVKRAIPGELLAVLLYSEKRRELRIRYAVGHHKEVVRTWSIPLGQGITGTAALRREPVLVADVRSDPRYLNGAEAVRTELAVPMIARRKLVGVIDMQSTRPNAFTAQDRALLLLIAEQVAISIDNARLYRRVERQNRLKKLASILQESSSKADPYEPGATGSERTPRSGLPEGIRNRDPSIHWLHRPNHVFQGRTPLEVIGSNPEAVEIELTRIDHGVYI
jgi:sigma-B regulation protein RsbU (phosphoserine phosphatase)